MQSHVCKFGGTSLADAAQMRKVRAIITSDPNRRYIVPSAPGKRHGQDQKVTDLLYLCHEHAKQNLPFDEVFALIRDRFTEIIADLKLTLDLEPALQEVQDGIQKNAQAGHSADYAASRGEYLNSMVIAALLDCPMVDAAKIIFFDPTGRLDETRTYTAIREQLGKLDRAVVPGFYGQGANDQIKTFSRGGSDVTGAIVARGIQASVYENWTDVSGVLMADPRIIHQPPTLEMITYRELRELAYMGATVLHDEAVFPVRRAGIPVNIRNTNDPEHPGTMIVATRPDLPKPTRTVSGIAGRKDFTIIAIEKSMMNQEVGFARRVLSVLETHGVSFEHMPSGIDTLSLVIADTQLHDGKLERVVEDLRAEVRPDTMEIYPDMAVIATVGRGMAYHPGIAGKLFTALGNADINIRMIDQGSSELNIIVGVLAADFEKAVHAIYEAFVDG